ncbi:MAG: pyridoxal phosphate-dependent aminotransferase [Dissulfurimicrobium sp.]|uniref:pyridoxal phosphate-dependent aminotransferase n=1 Tax=Dissulfurimicrobium sp. TaxID=2022436 RepID=UPI0040491AC9
MITKPPLAKRVRNLKPSSTLAIDAKAKALKANGADIINLSVGEPDFDTPEHIKEAAIKAVRDGFTKYTAVGGIMELKQAIIERLQRDYGLVYRPEEVMVSTGGKQVLYNIAQAIFDPGDEVILPVPYWVSYPAIVELAGGVVRYVSSDPKKGFALEVDAISAMITDRTKAIILNSPSNPTGAVYRSDDLRAVAELAVQRNIMIITDDIYDMIRFDGKGPENVASLMPEAKANTLIVNGVSKTYAMTGWRIGYMAGPEAVVKAATKIQSQSTSNPNSIAQKAAVAALTGPQDCVRKMCAAFKERKDFVMGRLNAMPGVNCVEPGGAFYVFPDLSFCYGARVQEKTIEGSLDLADYLLDEAKLAVIPGIAFGDDRFVRFSYAVDMETLKEGMDRLEMALSALKR